MSALKLLVNPTDKFLIIYVALILPFIWKLIFITSFAWIPPAEILILFGLLVFCMLFCVATLIDIKYTTRIKKYFSLPCYVVVALLFVWYPYKSYLLKKCEQEGNQIINRIELYKAKYKQYPPDLNAGFFKDLDLETPIHTNFEYDYIERNEKYNLRFYAFNSMTGSFYEGRWHYND